MVEYDVMSMVKLLFLFSLLALEHQNAQTGKVNVNYKMTTCIAARQTWADTEGIPRIPRNTQLF